MTGIGKNRRGVSANPSGPLPTPENCEMVSAGIPIQISPAQRGQIHHAHSPCKIPTETSQSLESANRSCLLGAGGTGNVQEKTFLINCLGIAGQEWYGGGISPYERKIPESHFRNTIFPGASQSAVLRVWSCDSSVAQYSRSDARSA
jgi:hypothetical protein